MKNVRIVNVKTGLFGIGGEIGGKKLDERCPVDDCREMRELKEEIAADRTAHKLERENDEKNKKEAYRFWIKMTLIIGLVIVASLLLTWANAKIVPDLVVKVEDHERRLTRTEVRQEEILINTKEILQRIEKIHNKP